MYFNPIPFLHTRAQDQPYCKRTGYKEKMQCGADDGDTPTSGDDESGEPQSLAEPSEAPAGASSASSGNGTVTYISCTPPVSSDVAGVLRFEGVMLLVCVFSGYFVYSRRRTHYMELSQRTGINQV